MNSLHQIFSQILENFIVLDLTNKEMQERIEKSNFPPISSAEWVHFHRNRSLALGRNTMIVYNRVPKCGSRTILAVIRAMKNRNNFTLKHSVKYGTTNLTRDEGVSVDQEYHFKQMVKYLSGRMLPKLNLYCETNYISSEHVTHVA